MGKDSFSFKKFTIRQDRCAMKVGTDGVLLGAWADVPRQGRIADIGTGTGLVAVMAAQRSTEAMITGIEIDRDAAAQAAENMEASPWGGRLDVAVADVNDFCKEHPSEFDCILSNPPFFTQDVKSDKEKRNVARHTGSLSFAQLALAVSVMLKDGGNFCVILPADAAMPFITEAVGCKLYLRKRTDIITKPGAQPKRVLMEFVKGGGMPSTVFDKLLLSEGGERTAEYRVLTMDFYL